ncbi:MAG: flagellar hook protein FlgE [Sulfuricurvum sp.]
MTQGYYAGISGLQTNQYGLDVIADNLANTSTTGYKGSTTEFADLLSQTINSASPTFDDVGSGARIQATSYQMDQGTLTPSDRFTDLALDGNGWFGVEQKGSTYFTRDGHFVFDTAEKTAGDANSSVSRLTTVDGMYVLGANLSNYSYDAAYDYGDTTSNNTSGAYVISNSASQVNLGTAGDQTLLELPTRLAYPVEPTTTMQFTGNLGTDDATRTISGDAISGNDALNRVTLTFTKSAVQPTEGVAWDVVATVTSKDGNTVYDTQNGQATFNASGILSSFDIASLDNDGSTVNLDLAGKLGGVVSVDGLAVSGASSADGMRGGILNGYAIDSDGIIVADFSNGRQSAIGRVAVYHFQNDQGLNRDGGTYFTESSDSGKPVFWTDANGNTITGATVNSNYLEASNVRPEVALTDMIVTQRAYQASAKTITTVDEMIQKALQMHK